MVKTFSGLMSLDSLNNNILTPDLNPILHLWNVAKWEIHIMDVQLAYLQQQHD